jgi:hypothetical protein
VGGIGYLFGVSGWIDLGAWDIASHFGEMAMVSILSAAWKSADGSGILMRTSCVQTALDRLMLRLGFVALTIGMT